MEIQMIFSRSNMLFTALAGLVAGALLVSCTSTPKTQTADPNFIGDFDPIQLETVITRTIMFGKEKPVELELYFIPRTNIVEMYYRDFANKICLMMTPEQRRLLRLAAADFSLKAEAGVLENRKPTSKNAYSETNASVAWGVTGVARVSEKAKLQLNYEYLSDGRPYFTVKLVPGPDKNDSTVYSPSSTLYMSPTQVQTLCEVIDQDVLQAMVDDLNARANEY